MIWSVEPRFIHMNSVCACKCGCMRLGREWKSNTRLHDVMFMRFFRRKPKQKVEVVVTLAKFEFRQVSKDVLFGSKSIIINHFKGTRCFSSILFSLLDGSLSDQKIFCAHRNSGLRCFLYTIIIWANRFCGEFRRCITLGSVVRSTCWNPNQPNKDWFFLVPTIF